MSKEIAVINPTIYEIKDILHNMGFKIYAEDKVRTTEIIFGNYLWFQVHPRELDRFRPLGPPPFNNPFRGRIRYQLKDENGKPTNPKYQTKNDVLNYLGEMIPKLKTRIEGHKMMEQHLKQQVSFICLDVIFKAIFFSKRKNNVRLNKRRVKVQNLVKISQGRKEKQKRKNRTVLNSASNFIKSSSLFSF